MAENIVNYTHAGFKALQDELNFLKNVKREEVKADIAKARSYGDLSENSEYDEAKNEQAKVEMRIHELEQMISVARIIDESEIDESVVSVGSIVKLFNKTQNREITYHIVGSYEANPFEGKISDQSPIGSGILGARKGETVTVELPNGSTVVLELLDVKRAAMQE